MPGAIVLSSSMPPEQSTGPKLKPTLLFVDDEERILRTLRLMFTSRYAVRTTTSGHEALDILRRERVHALVSDQRMPIMPGVELLRQAREVSPNTMRLLLTGYSDLQAVAGSINEGEIFRYISKPWNSEEIRVTIGSAVDIALSLDNPPPDEIHPEPLDERILVIDDDPDTARQITALLDQRMPGRHRVVCAADVESLLQVLQQDDFALVISEVRLAGENITDIIKALKRHQPHVVTLALTSYQDSATLVGLINQAQIHRFLLKPMRGALVWRGIESGLQRHRAMRASPRLADRHQVDSPERQAHPAARRILSFFQGLGKKPN
jgi:DNA-binding NtrC family response regulator